jgi:glycosyltransferase involved in cell wall biosynthesis
LGVGHGAKKVACDLSTNLDDMGHSVVILTFYERYPKFEYAGNLTCLNEKSTKHALMKIFKGIGRARKIQKICLKRRIDTVISFSYGANISVLLSRILYGNRKKIIVTEHNNPVYAPRLVKILEKKLYPKADLVVPVSKHIEIIFNKIFKVNNTKTIYNAKDTEEIVLQGKKSINRKHNALFGSNVVFFTIGRLCEQKNHASLIRAFKKMLSSYSDAKLIIRGSGEYEKNLIELIQKLKLEKSVILLETVVNIYAYIKKSDVFVLSSNYEGLPLVLLETLALGKPIVSTDCTSGPREILCPELRIEQEIEYPYYGKYGILVEPMLEENNFLSLAEKPLSNKEEKLADLMIELAKDTQLRKRYCNGLERAKEFDESIIIKEWENII